MPLILPSQRVIRPNPLVYPAGATPGFDPSHAALTGSTRLWCSAVANNGLFTQIAPTCQVASIDTVGTGSYSSRMDGLAGTCIRAGTVGQALTYGFPTSVGGAVPSPLTFAAIVNIQDITTTFQTIMTLGSSGGSHAYFYITAGVLELFFSGAGANDAIGISFKVGHSYFVAASSSPAGVNFVSRDLSTGIIQTSSIALGAGVGSFTLSSVTFCNDSFGDTGPNAVACGAAIQNFLSISQLVAWAADPWAFWYPRRTIQYTTPATTTTSGGARIRQRWNRSPLVYPAGAVPGVDLSHPVLAGGNKIIRSVVALGGNLIDIPTAIAGTQAVLPAASTDGAIGATVVGATDVGASTSTGQVFPQSVTVTASGGITFAFLTRIPAGLSVNFHYLIMERTGYFLELTNASPVGKLSLDFYTSGTNIISAIAPTLGNPCLLLVTTNSSYSFFVIKDLITGKVLTDLQAGTTTPTSTETVTCFNNYTNSSVPNGRSYGGACAAAAVIKGSCSPAVLLQWAADPWSFWYPNKTINLASSTASAGASFLPVWAYRYNLPVLGTGNF